MAKRLRKNLSQKLASRKDFYEDVGLAEFLCATLANPVILSKKSLSSKAFLFRFSPAAIILIDDRNEKENKMPTVKDIIVKKPSAAEAATCKAWPIWKCGPSTFNWEYTEKETCLVLKGKVKVTDDSDSVSFGPGDLVVFPDGLECTWHITESVTKHYNFG